MNNLYEIDGRVNGLLLTKIDPNTGEIMDSDSAFADMEAMELNRKEKQKNIILYFKNAEGEESIIDSEIKRLKELKVLVQRRQESAKKFLEESMKIAKETALDFVTCKAKFKKNPPSLVVEDGANVSAYQKVEMVTTLDKNAIKEDLNAGKVIKGCSLVSGERLEIK